MLCNGYFAFIGLYKQDLSLKGAGLQVAGYIQQTRFAILENEGDLIKSSAI
jgi:hypothetical protein